ncbi:MAG: PIN domain-containing protein [Vulcanimicrobiota bacterium]
MPSGNNPPAGYLAFDTSAYSQLRRGHNTVLRWLAAAERVDVCTVVIGELEAGFRLGARYSENMATLQDFLAEPFVFSQPITQPVSGLYGKLFAELRKNGTPIPTNDIWIAAAAAQAGAHLVTFDTDFRRVGGLAHTVLD